MQVSEINLNYVDNTLISNIEIHFKPKFPFLHLLKTGYQKFFGVFRGIEMEHWLKLA